MYWKTTWGGVYPYPSCEEIILNEGMIVSHVFDWPVKYILKAVYQQNCYQNSIPVLNTNVGLVIDKFSEPLPIIAQSWTDFTRNNSRGSFSYSVVPIVYAISVLAVIIWFLTIFVLTNYTVKPSWLLKGSTFLSSVYILLVVVKSIVCLHRQQREGYLHGAQLLDQVNGDRAVNIMDLIVVMLLQINQVQIIMRLFQRQKDKRLTFYVGMVATLLSQVIWSVSLFHNFHFDDEAGDILPAFIYLVRIAMALCYAAIITVYFISKIKLILANRRIWLLTLLTLILIYSPVAFFIADVSNAFIYELSEIFSVVNYVIGVVIPWEWCNKFNIIMKAKEKEGVLGRRFYEDESYELDRFELFVEEQAPGDEDDGDYNEGVGYREDENGLHLEDGERGVYNMADMHNSVERTPAALNSINCNGVVENSVSGDGVTNSLSNSEPSRTRRHEFKSKFKKSSSKSPTSMSQTFHGENSVFKTKLFAVVENSKNAFISLTDHIIAAGFAIPRSVSVSSQSQTKVQSQSQGHGYGEDNVTNAEERALFTAGDNVQGANRQLGNRIVQTNSVSNSTENNSVSLGTNRNRRNVYVYAKKEVVIDLSEDENELRL
ncbi:pH-response regulator protein palH/RIM21 [Lodderomyces elongisporus NRRL YB-4239]|uniref:pH-response regulator protein palH/RIM21 n=1 Tax=Lodderomyces elongisporus (strain ATCC 11503 / CBS 2605 / JCM 1781 / NBRC 1676 / NRRL YB-4239) TaxID=379508 RepID=A5E2D3_LODEL|nr:pH-response regulator protein palH/RIM21 [Lodderomyces elongisporus NRRL YB-4239]